MSKAVRNRLRFVWVNRWHIPQAASAWNGGRYAIADLGADEADDHPVFTNHHHFFVKTNAHWSIHRIEVEEEGGTPKIYGADDDSDCVIAA